MESQTNGREFVSSEGVFDREIFAINDIGTFRQ